ncbi:hypothetical protein GCM10009565_46960 [Amycolatopsis albidoflavus]
MKVAWYSSTSTTHPPRTRSQLIRRFPEDTLTGRNEDTRATVTGEVHEAGSDPGACWAGHFRYRGSGSRCEGGVVPGKSVVAEGFPAGAADGAGCRWVMRGSGE